MLAKADQMALEAEQFLPRGQVCTTEMLAVRVQLAHYWRARAVQPDATGARMDLDKVREWASEYGWKMKRWVHPTVPGMWELMKDPKASWLAAFDNTQGTFEGAAHLHTAQGTWLINYLDDFLEELES